MTTMPLFCLIILANFYCTSVLAAEKRKASECSSNEEHESKRRRIEKSYSSNSDIDEDAADAAWNAEEDPDFGENGELYAEQSNITQTDQNDLKICIENFKEIIDTLKIAGLTRHEIYHLKNALEKDKHRNLEGSKQLKNIVDILAKPSSIPNQTPRDAIISHFTKILQISIPPENTLSDDDAAPTNTSNTLDQASGETATNGNFIAIDLTSLDILRDHLKTQKIDGNLLEKTMEYCANFSQQKITDILSIPLFDLSRRLQNLVDNQDYPGSSQQKGSGTPEGFNISFGNTTSDSPGTFTPISQLMVRFYGTSNSARPIKKQHPLIARLIELGLLPIEESDAFLAQGLYYPTRAFASLNAPIIIDPPISFNTNVGIKNANGNDCWLIALLQSFYASRHNKNLLLNGVKNMQLKDDEKALFYELAVIGYALGAGEVLLYDFTSNASAIIRTFFTTKDHNQKSLLLPEMAFGHQDVNEAFMLLVDKLARANYAINLVSELKGNTSYSRKLEQQSNLTVELVGSTLKECLDYFFSVEDNVFFEGENKLKKFHIAGPFPCLLAITIKRFDVCLEKGLCIKNNNYMSFPFELDMKDYSAKIDGEYASGDDTHYELMAIIYHIGEIQRGHYWAFCKDSQTGIWYRYDNEERRSFSFEDMRALGEMGFELLPTQEEATPYMLFYEKK